MSFKKVANVHVHDVLVGDSKDHFHAMVVCDDKHQQQSDSFQKYVQSHEKEMKRKYDSERREGAGGKKDKIDTYQSYYQDYTRNLVSESDYYNVDWGEIDDLTAGVVNTQFSLDSTDSFGGRFTSMIKAVAIILLTNLRVILVEFLMLYFL